jgi:hypothetical protein
MAGANVHWSGLQLMQRLSLMHPKPEVSTWPIPQHEIVKKACGANGTGQFDFFLLTGLGGLRLLVNGNTKKNKNVGLMPRKLRWDLQSSPFRFI